MITGEKRTEKEYRALDMLSASDLRLFSNNRRDFYKQKILKEEKIEEYNRSMMIGSLVHLLLLEPEEFDNRYMMSSCDSPPTANMLLFTESLFRHSVEHMDEEGKVNMDFKDLAELAYIDSGYKTPMATVLLNFNKKGESYYQELMEAKIRGVQVVCMDDINIATKIVEGVKSDPFVGEYFTDTDFCELKAEGFMVEGIEMKGMLDKLSINHVEKTIQLLDLKVVFDNQNFYREYYKKKQAYIQGYIYHTALLSGKLDLGFEYDNYEILPPIFIAVDSGCFYAPLQYKMSVEDLDRAYEGWEEKGYKYLGVRDILKDIRWSKENNIWNIGKEAYENRGIVELK